VTALIRDPTKLPLHLNLRITVGTPASLSSVRTAFNTDDSTDHNGPFSRPIEAVISCLATPGSPSPLDPPATPFLVTCAQNLLKVMREHHVSKYVTISAAGVGESYPYTGLLSHLLLHATNLLQAYAEHEAVEGLFKQAEEEASSGNTSTNFRWVAVRSVLMTEGEKKPVATWGENGKGMRNEITRASLGDFLVRAVEEETWDGTTPVVSN
jgi:hypothetical protein